MLLTRFDQNCCADFFKCGDSAQMEILSASGAPNCPFNSTSETHTKKHLVCSFIEVRQYNVTCLRMDTMLLQAWLPFSLCRPNKPYKQAHTRKKRRRNLQLTVPLAFTYRQIACGCCVWDISSPPSAAPSNIHVVRRRERATKEHLPEVFSTQYNAVPQMQGSSYISSLFPHHAAFGSLKFYTSL